MKPFGGKKFGSNDGVIGQTNTFPEDLDKSFLLEGVKKLGQCMALKGEYVEKFKFFFCRKIFVLFKKSRRMYQIE